MCIRNAVAYPRSLARRAREKRQASSQPRVPSQTVRLTRRCRSAPCSLRSSHRRPRRAHGPPPPAGSRSPEIAAASAARAVSSSISSSNSIWRASPWPMKTGTRTQVAITSIEGSSIFLAGNGGSRRSDCSDHIHRVISIVRSPSRNRIIEYNPLKGSGVS